MKQLVLIMSLFNVYAILACESLFDHETIVAQQGKLAINRRIIHANGQRYKIEEQGGRTTLTLEPDPIISLNAEIAPDDREHWLEAVAASDTKRIIAFIKKFPQIINESNVEGMTALAQTAKTNLDGVMNRNEQLFLYLLEKGANAGGRVHYDGQNLSLREFIETYRPQPEGIKARWRVHARQQLLESLNLYENGGRAAIGVPKQLPAGHIQISEPENWMEMRQEIARIRTRQRRAPVPPLRGLQNGQDPDLNVPDLSPRNFFARDPANSPRNILAGHIVGDISPRNQLPGNQQNGHGLDSRADVSQKFKALLLTGGFVATGLVAWILYKKFSSNEKQKKSGNP